MWSGLSVLWLAFAVSLDSFGAGTTYGMRGIRIPFSSASIIAACSGSVIYLSMWVGRWLVQGLPTEYVHFFGAFLFIALGIWGLYQGMKSEESDEVKSQQDELSEPKVWTLKINPLGLVIQILKTPMAADVDRSGTISGSEAFLLGLALSLDSMGAGIGAAMMGLPSLLMALSIAGMCACFLYLGMWVGLHYIHRFSCRFLAFLPGTILIIMGLLRFL